MYEARGCTQLAGMQAASSGKSCVAKGKGNGLKSSSVGNRGHAGLPPRGPSLETHNFAKFLGLRGHHQQKDRRAPPKFFPFDEQAQACR